MSTPFIQSLYNQLGYAEDLSELHDCGVLSTILGGRVPLFSLMFDRLFRDEIHEKLFHIIKSKLDDAKYRAFQDQLSIISIYDDRYFEDFSKMGMRLWFEDPSGDFEKTLNIDLVFCTDPKFNVRQIPIIWDEADYEQMIARGKNPFSRDSVYILRVETNAKVDGLEETYFEYLLYFPNKAFCVNR